MGAAIPIVSLFTSLAGGVFGAQQARKSRKQQQQQFEQTSARQDEAFRKQEKATKDAEEKQREEFSRNRRSLLAGRFGKRQTFFQGDELGGSGDQGRNVLG